MRFTCPRCGGHTWGTYGHWEDDKTKWRGNCNGFLLDPQMAFAERCRFTWMRTEDEKYGLEPFDVSPDIGREE